MEILNIIIKLIVPTIPVLVLLIGGQKVLDNFAYRKKEKETEIELIATIRNKQYETLTDLYSLFAKFMELYRRINSPLTDLKKTDVREQLFLEAIIAESKIDAIILKIGGEFTEESDNHDEIENMLGNLRQSVQIWRESIVNSNKLPFNISTQEDYMRFKIAFTNTSVFMINRINNLKHNNVKMKNVEKILVDAFHFKHEQWKDGHFYMSSVPLDIKP